MYSTCNAHAPYCHLWPATLYHIVPHYLIQGTIFEKKVTRHKMCVLNFWINFLWNFSNSTENWLRDNYKCMLVFMWSTGYCCQILMTLNCSWDFFSINTEQFHENPSNGRRVAPCGRMDGPSDLKLTVALRNFAKASKTPCSLPKEDQVSRLYMELYSAAWSVCDETNNIQLTAVTGTDGLPHSQ